MELRCGRCNEYLAIAGHGGTCINGHNICTHCYNRPHPPPCVACQIKTTTLTCGSVPEPNTLNRVPHTQANSSPQPVVSPTATPQFQTSANANPQPSVLPSAVSQPYTPPYNTLQPSRTLCSTTEFHTSQETWFRPPAPEESGCQNSTQGMEGGSDVDQMLHNIQMGNSCFRPQQVEQNSDVGQSRTTGTVRQLTEKYDSLGIMTDEGATGWKNQEENARTPQGSSYTLRQQDSIVGCKESQDTQSNTPSLTPPSEGQRTPQQKRYYIRGSPPYPPNILTKDRYLTGPRTREPMPSPSGSTNTFPPPGNRHPSPSTSSAANRHTNPPHSSLRPRDPSPSSSSARNPSRSSSRNRYPSSSSSSSSIRQTNPSRSSSRTREPSPSSINAGSHSRSSSRSRDPSSTHPRISSPSPARQSDRFRSSSSPRDPSRPSSRHSSPSLYTSGSRKSSTPSETTEPSTAPFHSSGAMFPVTHNKGEHANGATSHHAATHEPQLKQPLTPITTEGLTYPRVQRSITTPTATVTRRRHLEELDQRKTEEKGLPGELMVWQEKGSNPQHEELKRRQDTQKSLGEGLSKEIHTLQQSAMKFEGKLNLKKEMLDVKEVEWAWLKEEYAKQQKEIVELEEKDRKHQEELGRLKEISLAQQNQAQEHITMTQEITELKEEVTALREAKDAQEKEASHWKAKYDEQRAATEEEIRQFKEQECSRLEKDYNRWALKMTEMQNKVAAREGEISQYLEKHNFLQNEFQRVQEEWIRSKGEVSKLSMENAQHQEEKIKHEEEVRDLKQEMSAKRKEWIKERNLYTENIVMLEGKVDSLGRENSSLWMKEQENQVALRRSKDDITYLISERDSCQEEIKKLKKDKEIHKENMAQLRRERDDHQMKLHALENRPLQSPRLTEQINTLLLDIDKLKRREARQQEEATRLRQERDNSKEEADQLKRKEETELTQLRQERDRYKEKADQLKGRQNIYLEKANDLSVREKKVTELQQERDSMEREIDQLRQEENTIRRERDEYKEKADNLEREVTTLKNQMTVIGRERDNYKEQIDERETQYNKIIQMATEKNNYKIREDEESSMIALLQQEIHNYRMRIEEHKGNETELEYKIMKMRTEMENHVRDLDAQIKKLQQDKGCYKEWVNEYKISEATLKKQIEHMGRVIENQEKNMLSQIAQLVEERDGYEKEAEAAKHREASLENQLKQIQDKSKHETEVVERCKRREDEYRQKVDQLTRKNYILENQLQEMARDKDSCKREAEREVKKAIQLTSKNCELEKKLKQMTKDKEDIEGQNKEGNECRLRMNQLSSKNSELENQLEQVISERDSLKKKVDSYKDSNKHKQETDHLKTRQDAEVTQHGQGTDQHQTVAERLSKQSGAGDARPREAAQSERELSDFLATPTCSQQSMSGTAEVREVADVVMADPEEGATPGLREEQQGIYRLEVPGTQGLPNLGNTCYISSVVQCLYHLSPLRHTLVTCHQYLYQHNQSGTGVAAALAQLFGAMQTANEMGVRFATRELKSVLGSYDATFNGRQQQEAHDLFTALVSCLQSDLSQHGSLDTLSRDSFLFDGQLETRMVCLKTGAPLTHTTEAFTSLSLPVVHAREWFLTDLLDKHFRVQEMDWDCERCHFTHKCSHSTRIHRCPPLLVIHFSRVANYNSARKVKVNFPVAELNLQPYIAPDAPRPSLYQLVGVVCHEGTMACGHYTAYCRYGSGRRSGRWRLCNDMHVRDVKQRTVLEDESAHMLFYIQQ